MDLHPILNSIANITVCVVGDVCLDLYWTADMKKSRLSRETPHYPLPVVDERASLGGGGNVMANAAALGVKRLLPVSVIGNDWRAFLLKEQLAKLGADLSGIIADPARVTPCYCKPLRTGISDVVYEDPRLDFENYLPPDPGTEAAVIAALDRAAAEADVIAVSDQLTFGVITPKVRKRICQIGKTKPVIVDSRDSIGRYRNVIVKPNDVEAEAATGMASLEAAIACLSQKTGAAAIVTCGPNGALWFENGNLTRIPAVRVEPPVDTVGAGDTFLAAFACAYAAGADGPAAVAFANRAAAVTVKKIGTTGTASPEELLGSEKETQDGRA
ncbi:MAG: sugar kinase [Clostridia bacterium]|nr:sugar kinase [Clostridia bacterium]